MSQFFPHRLAILLAVNMHGSGVDFGGTCRVRPIWRKEDWTFLRHGPKKARGYASVWAGVEGFEGLFIYYWCIYFRFRSSRIAPRLCVCTQKAWDRWDFLRFLQTPSTYFIFFSLEHWNPVDSLLNTLFHRDIVLLRLFSFANINKTNFNLIDSILPALIFLYSRISLPVEMQLSERMKRNEK